MISIITPTHKKGKFWDLTVESVMQQTCLDFEWVILDNSKDFYFRKDFEAFKKAHPEYKEAYKNVKIYEEKAEDTQKPTAYYKNRCVELTTCSDNDFVVVFDHDDLMYNTTVEDFVNCIKKYGDSVDYITGSAVALHNVEDKFKPETDYNPYTTTPIKNKYDLTIGKDFKLALSQVEVPQIKRIDYSVFDMLISSHPRAIRKRFLKNNIFSFYEKSRLEEDTLQVMLAPIVLNLAWIDRYTIIYVLYEDQDGYKNACANKTEKDYLEHQDINRGLTLLYEGFRKLYKDKTSNEFYHYNDFEIDENKKVKATTNNATKKQPSGKSKKK